MTRRQKQQALDDLAARLLESKCPLRKKATNPVPGEGDPDADFLFIGEAPGRNEDKTGRPFVGAAGKVLTSLLETINLKREDVFITSIEKFRPPDNRAPKPKEVMACFPTLEEQIRIIEPKVVIALGRHALRRLLEWEYDAAMPLPPIDEMHGKPIQSRHGFIIYPVYHPAAALYSRKLLPTLQGDFKRLLSL